ncbi:hypothetical protein I6A84_01175 [Frankia sp. CNm7]|uniref:DUF6924 domain-containing protein n=1 Tax=Frankia nepalensis TaxID=1836974 RepID=A0A937UP40_9ACTN|nr:hypothetical protein [Frankia nepalensis]MBL7496131.1 hypothetical protein [Frankia nepalensis]MBL7508930.1 hypothetical protein [Frankia nepalensis]MBL7516770.1 hypothetical protein [Frankia nepalensis]MBL7628708.1 hypothetical protein [Frankia nepalensis]
MSDLPELYGSLLVRTDFSDDAAWEAVCAASVMPSPEGFDAHLFFVNDPELADLTVDQVVALPGAQQYGVLFIVDHMTISDPENPVVAVEPRSGAGRHFRVIPAAMWSVENNLSIGNLQFSVFADSADPDGVFRGFASGG